ncbi:MAG: DoxX family membrane protein [Actinobacteria bacterium]|nr:DoxX family membrane protein [Actinomycetota bacterium]
MLLRRIARPLFATWFVNEGLDAALHPIPHVRVARDGMTALVARLPERVQVPSAVTGLTDAQLTLAVRAHGAATAAAGLALAAGRAPRTAAAALAVLVAPTILTSLPTPWRLRGSAEEVRARRDRLVRAMAFTGGAALTAADYEGRPGVSWRVRQVRAARAASNAGGPHPEQS